MTATFRWIPIVMAGLITAAWAAPDPETTPPDPNAPISTDEAPPQRLRCRLFEAAADATVDTRDVSTDLGRWILDHEDRGWEVENLDMKVGQKPTGFAQVYVQVCLVPQR